jgi:hypothetical protein
LTARVLIQCNQFAIYKNVINTLLIPADFEVEENTSEERKGQEERKLINKIRTSVRSHGECLHEWFCAVQMDEFTQIVAKKQQQCGGNRIAIFRNANEARIQIHTPRKFEIIRLRWLDIRFEENFIENLVALHK